MEGGRWLRRSLFSSGSSLDNVGWHASGIHQNCVCELVNMSLNHGDKSRISSYEEGSIAPWFLWQNVCKLETIASCCLSGVSSLRRCPSIWRVPCPFWYPQRHSFLGQRQMVTKGLCGSTQWMEVSCHILLWFREVFDHFESPDEVIKAGKAHGAQAEDIYGCLYFFLLDELSSFARRLRQLRITFNIFNLTASDLSLAIRHNSFWSEGIPASIRFDRIEVSNILDVNYIGIRGVVSNWASLLSKNASATILGYFMNWTMLQEDGDMSTGKDLRAVQRVARVWAAKMKVRIQRWNALSKHFIKDVTLGRRSSGRSWYESRLSCQVSDFFLLQLQSNCC